MTVLVTVRAARGRDVPLPGGAVVLVGEEVTLERTPFVLRRLREMELELVPGGGGEAAGAAADGADPAPDAPAAVAAPVEPAAPTTSSRRKAGAQ